MCDTGVPGYFRVENEVENISPLDHVGVGEDAGCRGGGEEPQVCKKAVLQLVEDLTTGSSHCCVTTSTAPPLARGNYPARR